MLEDINPVYFFIILSGIIVYGVSTKNPEMTQLREIRPQKREVRLF